MEQKNYLYSSGDFAKLVGVNKRTLHYYNDIGLFCPKEIGENGYHYYTCFQFAELELILTLRKIGLSIDEIREYVTKTSKKTIASTMQKQKEMIEASIRQLVVAQDFLERKMERLKLAKRNWRKWISLLYMLSVCRIRINSHIAKNWIIY